MPAILQQVSRRCRQLEFSQFVRAGIHRSEQCQVKPGRNVFPPKIIKSVRNNSQKKGWGGAGRGEAGRGGAGRGGAGRGDRKSTRLNSSHAGLSRMPSSA